MDDLPDSSLVDLGSRTERFPISTAIPSRISLKSFSAKQIGNVTRPACRRGSYMFFSEYQCVYRINHYWRAKWV